MPEPNAPLDLHRRKQYLIEKKFQYRVIINLVLLVVGTVITAHLVAIGYQQLMKISQVPSANPGTALSFSGMASSLLIPLLITAILGIVFVLAFGLFYSHRIAGPLFNLKRMMNKLGDGNLSVVMHIRSTDEFHDVAESFNLMVRALNQRHAMLLRELQELPETSRKKFNKLWLELFVPPEEPVKIEEPVK